MIKWKEEYSLGIELIDEQHEKLFEIANRAYELLNNDLITDKYDKIIEIIVELKEYTIFHFKSEEKYMLDIRYKRFLSHKVEHEKFINQIKDIDLTVIDLNQDEYVRGLLKVIINWIDEHILNQDKLIIED